MNNPVFPPEEKGRPDPPPFVRKPGSRSTFLLLLLCALVFFAMDYRCPIKAVSGICCPGCGMTRALQSFLGGHLLQSLSFHALLLPTAAAGILATYFARHGKERALLILAWSWAACMIFYWLFRLCFGLLPV